MISNRFLNDPDIKKLVEEAVSIKTKGTIFSDITDENGYQYVDLVQEGGGVLGIALLGYTYILEKAGIRFYSLAGTSAGSINSLLMASLAKPGKPTSEKIINILGEKNFFDFLDGPQGVKKLIHKLVTREKGILWNVIFNAYTIFLKLKYKLGLNPGKDFEAWLSEILHSHGVSNLKTLKQKREQIPNIKHRNDPEYRAKPPRLSIITSEITTRSKVEFPKMADLYWKNPEAIDPVKFVRTSMSIPFLFYPYEVDDLPNASNIGDIKWDEYVSYNGKVPERVKFVDGGMLSNFPINTFHIKGVPSRPTFGVRLSTYRERYSNNDRFFDFCGSMISTMRQIHDYDFILQNPDYKRLICKIDADEKFNWLNFGMSPEKQQQLFLLGAQKAIRFLYDFNWEEYKEIRRKLVV
ncbi:patatin-like phospholipase family protein [Gramella sp. KN1008]|uniref:patatin-like phospholipase family protein n=1 Tax=Gramella sp. KN1008 TaxID=2529298 RepID=UPI00103E0496|nr:patatin-like phospholipase family protein [Gramella sp. KN1008]TBW28675.1 alpha/beta hydrolase [Gramella sp. KN1008]